LVGESVYIFGCWFTANRLNFWFSITRALGLLGRFFTILYLSKCTWVKMHHFNYAYILEAFLIGSTTAFLYFKHPKSPSWGKFDRVIFKSLFRDGILIGIGLVLYYLFLRFDRILLEKMVHSDSLGLYTTVIQLNDAWLNIGIMVCSILGPYFIFNCRDNKIAQKRLYKMIFVILPISALICIIMPVMSPFLITNILGEKYKNGVNLFNLSCWLSLFVFANQIFSLWWLKQKSYINQIIVWILGILIMFFTRNIFVVNYDIYGMIYASFLAYAVMLVYQFVYIRLK
jgi:O-antigen/teichoic acid export membrane protein